MIDAAQYDKIETLKNGTAVRIRSVRPEDRNRISEAFRNLEAESIYTRFFQHKVACFDTSFHRTQPDVAQMFALPTDLREAGVLRYGFHGLYYKLIASVLPDIEPKTATGSSVVLHLGDGASMCAIKAVRSLASTMGFTAVEGLPMGTRSGSLDPGVILYLMDQQEMEVRAIENLIYTQSGLLGVSGIFSNMRTLL
jgi:acetate kinase